MSRKTDLKHSQNVTAVPNIDEKVKSPKVIEELNSHFLKTVPRVRTNKNLFLYAYQKRKIIVKIDMTDIAKNEILILESILSKLEIQTAKLHIIKVQLPLDDFIINYCTVGQFKEACERTLKNLQIILIKQPEKITSDEKKTELMSQFDNFGQKKLCAKLRANYLLLA